MRVAMALDHVVDMLIAVVVELISFLAGLTTTLM